MNNYINIIFISTFLGGIILAIAPEKGEIKKYIKFTISLLCIICIVSPLASLLNNLSSAKTNLKNYINDLFIREKIELSNELIINAGVDKIEKGIKETIIQEYGFKENEILVELVVNQKDINAIKIEKINVFLTGEASWSDANKLEKYLSEHIGGDIIVKRR